MVPPLAWRVLFVPQFRLSSVLEIHTVGPEQIVPLPPLVRRHLRLPCVTAIVRLGGGSPGEDRLMILIDFERLP